MSDTTITFFNETLTRYTIQEKLGTGGMARVYRGHDRNLDREVAIKVLHEHLAEADTFKERFEREAKLVAAINHPNIVQVYDYNTVERGNGLIYYMVMSYIPGVTLQDLMEAHCEQETRLSIKQIVSIMEDLTDALTYAHQQGMVHRDVKPANIIIRQEDNTAILTDFGIARMAVASNLTQEGATVGTPAYMSPEQATGEMVDARSDLYALGIILYEMLTGSTPFEDDGSLSVLLKHLNDPVPAISEQVAHLENDYLDAVIYKALAKKPEDRYQSAQDMMADLRRALGDQEPLAMQSRPQQTININPKATSSTLEIMTTQTTRALRSPIGILVIGMAAILLLLGASVLFQEGDGDSIEEPIYFSTQFSLDDEMSNAWPLDELANLSRRIEDDGYIIRNTESRSAIPTVFTLSDMYQDVTIELTGRLTADSDGPSAYGIVFRYIDENNYNVFAVDGLGRYSVWVREDGNWTELRNADASPDERWTMSEIINPAGQTNMLEVGVYDTNIIGYVNGEQILMVQDAVRTGGVGIYVASTAEENATAIIEHYRVAEGPTSMTGSESMTGDDPTATPES
jgi:serine/threonine protein kinase